MRKNWTSLLAIGGVVSWMLTGGLRAAEPANRKASASARKILDYFYALKNARVKNGC